MPSRPQDHARTAADAVEQGTVTESVEAVTEANTLLSGLGFESDGVAAAHSIHDGLTQLEATPAAHGEKVNIGSVSPLVLEGRLDAFIEEYVEFSLALALPATLADIGHDGPIQDQLDVVTEACDDDEAIHNQPFAVSPPMVRDAIRTADEIAGRTSD